MFCSNCGNEIINNSGTCPCCGTTYAISGNREDIAINLNKSNNYNTNFTGNNSNTSSIKPLKTDRNLITVILFSLITAGIYGLYFIHQTAHDINIACKEDGKETSGALGFTILSLITGGLYSIIWSFNINNRLYRNAYRYNLTFKENGTTVVLWYVFGSLLFFVGPFVALYILIKNLNKICIEYNEKYGL